MATIKPQPTHVTERPDNLGKRYVVRNEDGKKIWGADLGYLEAKRLKNITANRRKSTTAMMEEMPPPGELHDRYLLEAEELGAPRTPVEVLAAVEASIAAVVPPGVASVVENPPAAERAAAPPPARVLVGPTERTTMFEIPVPPPPGVMAAPLGAFGTDEIKVVAVPAGDVILEKIQAEREVYLQARASYGDPPPGPAEAPIPVLCTTCNGALLPENVGVLAELCTCPKRVELSDAASQYRLLLTELVTYRACLGSGWTDKDEASYMDRLDPLWAAMTQAERDEEDARRAADAAAKIGVDFNAEADELADAALEDIL